MSSIINLMVIAILFIAISSAVIISYKKRTWVSFSIFLVMLIRMVFSVLLSQNLKYLFVVDSLNYEYKGWLLAQPWMSDDLFITLTPFKNGQFNYYEIFLSWIFKIFGRDPLIATFFNCLFSTLTILILWATKQRYFTKIDSNSFESNKFDESGLIYILLMGAYPSYLVWSTTNTRDPLYFLGCAAFFFSFFTVFSRQSKAILPTKALAVVSGAFSFWLVLGVRNYVNWLFLLSIAAGLIVYSLAKLVSWRRLSFTAPIALIGGSLLFERIFPYQCAHLIKQLAFTRESFANLKLLDSVTKSSFSLGQEFHTVLDIWLFLPSALAHYFFGPFIWDVANFVQLFSLLESGAVMLLAYPTIVGAKKLFKNAPLETIIIMTFSFIFSVSQSLAISNMGTIYRHRTLSFLFILLFASEGVYEITKKNYPRLFAT